MRTHWKQIAAAGLLACGMAAETAHAAAPATAQGLITGNAFHNITGGGLAVVTNNVKFPNNPDATFFYPHFEWNANEDITIPASNYADNYGAQLIGYFYPPTTGNYVFYLAADDNASLFLSTNSTAAGKRLIARETAYSNTRGYTIDTATGTSDITAKDSSTFAGTEWPSIDPGTGTAVITLQAGQPYYIEAMVKDGTGGDNLSVAVVDPTGLIDSTMPIPGQYLSTDRTTGPVMITTQPANQTVAERGSVTFRVAANGTPPYTYQWRVGGADIPDATGSTFTVTGATMANNNANYSVVVTGPDGAATSGNAVLTVTPDTALPTVLSSKASSSLTDVVVTFSEAVDEATATTLANYQISSTNGPLAVTAATLSPGGTQVTLTTAQQTLGTKYTVLISNVKDIAGTPNTIAANSKSVFLPTGKLAEQNGFIVFEAENYDRNTDGIWVRNTTRGTPSGGASVVSPNGAGGSESATQLEYDVEFAQAATYNVWYRASADNGDDDSIWLHIDGARPVERSDANDAAMSGFSGQADFVWRSDAFTGLDPFTVDVAAPGQHVIAIARREDGAFMDKIILTTDAEFVPTGFGPPETRAGLPGMPTISITAPAAGTTYGGGANIAFTVNSAGQSGLDVSRVQYSANGTVIGESTTAPFNFTYTNAAAGIYAIRATAFDEIGQSTISEPITVTVGTPPPQALLVVGTAAPTNPSDLAIKSRLESQGWQVTLVQAPASKTADADGKQLVLISSTINSGDVAAKFTASAVPIINWEQAVQDDLLFTLNTDGTDRGTITGQTQVNIVKADHPLAAGLTTGAKTVTSAAQDFGWGNPNENAIVIATAAANPDQAMIYAYDTGAVLIDGATTAPARRVQFFQANDSFVLFTEDATKLFDAAVQWASGVLPPPTGAKIAWVSFHRADDAPSAGAAGAGFTEAADVAYTDLLRQNGHDVTRIVTSGTPDAALLNAFDLVIISRAVGSGDYETAAEAAAWNGITAPTMILGGYIIRANRLGYTVGSTMIDTTGDIRLTVTAPTHPIFAGVALDAANTMVNPFAGIVTNNSVVMRGISVSTGDVIEGGTVLATVGTPEDAAVDGMIIGEFQAGATMSNAGASTLAGHRLVFLTGSREANATSAETAGLFDLTADGARMFLNAVDYMAEDDGGGTTPTISIDNTGNTVTVTFTGNLQSTPSLTNPVWTPVATTSPYTVPTTDRMRFFRSVSE